MNIDEGLQKWSKRLIILIFCLILFFFCQRIGVIKAIINVFVALTPLYIAIFVSWMMQPVARYLTDKWKIKYCVSCFLSIILMALVVCVLIFTIIPEIFFQIKGFINTLSTSITSLFNQLEQVGVFKKDSRFFTEIDQALQQYNLSLDSIFRHGLDFVKNNSNYITDGINSTIGVVQSVIGVIAQIGLGFLLSFYLMPNFNHYVNLVVKKVNKDKQKSFREDLTSISVTLRKYLKGLLLDTVTLCIILSVLTSIFFGAKIGIMTAIVFSLIAALFNIIPYVGPIIGAIPLVLVVFQSYGILGIIGASILIFLAQFVESNIIYPRIMGNSINMHPVTLMVGLLVCSTLFGFVGMFISTPLLSIIKIFLVKFGVIGEDDL